MVKKEATMLFFFKPMVAYVRAGVLVQSLYALMSRSLQSKTLVLPPSGKTYDEEMVNTFTHMQPVGGNMWKHA